MNFLYFIYFTLPNFQPLGLPGKGINRLLSITLKKIFDFIVPVYLKSTSGKAEYGLNTQPREKEYIVSVTSFPDRINYIWITLETILRQSFKPDRLILWLAEEQFPERRLPESLLRLQKRGLTIEYCEDLKSHKKYYFAMQKYPEAYLITLDDDLYYPRHVLKNLVDLNRKYPATIPANRAHRITYRNGKILPYRKWRHNVTDSEPSHLLVATGGAGALYAPSVFHGDIFEKRLIKNLCFHADDLWLKVMALKNRTMIVTNKRYNKDFVCVSSTQRSKLVEVNVISKGNDVQLEKLMEYYNLGLPDFLEA